MNTYQKPSLEVFGAVEELTRFSGVPTRTDSVFLNGHVIAAAPTSTGSIDQCIFTGGKGDPNSPAVCV